MIFTFEHIKKIWLEQKTQTRRWSEKVPTPLLYNRYKAGQLYAVQEGRGKPGLKDMKIRVIRKWIETKRVRTNYLLECLRDGGVSGVLYVGGIPISAADAQAEGGYNPENYEVEFKRLNKKWDGKDRVGLEFEVVRV